MRTISMDGHDLGDALGQLDLELGGRAEARALVELRATASTTRRVRPSRGSSGPTSATKSMYSLPSTSQTWLPLARS